MKTLIIILILASFLQTTILPIDLVLLVLIFRSYLVSDESNLYLAFFFGLLVSHLSGTTLGVQSLVYLTLVQIVRIISSIPALNSIITIIPITFIGLTFNSAALSIINGSSIQLWPKILLESIAALPVYLLIRFWEERFVIRSEIKLRMKG